jgi:hypothetical protein
MEGFRNRESLGAALYGFNMCRVQGGTQLNAGAAQLGGMRLGNSIL